MNQGEGPFTIFAPSDDAFVALAQGTVEDLLKPESKDQPGAIGSQDSRIHRRTGSMQPAQLALHESRHATQVHKTVTA